MKLYNDDCINVLEKLVKENIKVNAIICDPPYGTTQNKNDISLNWNEIWPLLYKLRKDDNTPIVLFSHHQFQIELGYSNFKNYKFKFYVNKKFSTNFLNAKKQPLRIIDEIMIFGTKGKKIYYYPQMWKGKMSHKSYGSKNPKNQNYGEFKSLENTPTDFKYPIEYLEFDYNHPSIRIHQQEKPIKLMEYLIKIFTKKNELVLDFTMGSGSTGLACMNLNRDFIGIEKDKNTFLKTKERLENQIKWEIKKSVIK